MNYLIIIVSFMQKMMFCRYLEFNVKASSLMNAVFICLIISIFSGCLVLISHYQNLFNTQLYMYEDLIGRNESSFNYLINNVEKLSYDKIETLDVFEDDIVSTFEKKKWGFYDILVCKTIFKNDTISKTALVGQQEKTTDKLALYVTDYNKSLKLSGKTAIFGDIKVPNGITERAYINGKEGNSIRLNGNVQKSTNQLPKINKDLSIDISNYKKVLIKTFLDDVVISNGFDKPTLVIDLEGLTVLDNVKIKGNIILYSNEYLEIGNTANLQDVLVVAPSIHVLSRFEGNIQMVAEEFVGVDKEVFLKYPSSIYIKSKSNPVSVTINTNSTLIGGVVIDGDYYSEAAQNLINIHEKATIVGDVYCYGKTQLEGSVIGSVYTDKFYLKTQSSSYENVILNGTINRDSLSDNFIGLPLFQNALEKKKYAVIKEF